MGEHDEQNIIAKQPTLLERLRLTDPEAAQAIERLEGELASYKTVGGAAGLQLQTWMQRAEKAEQQLAEARVSLDRARQPSEAANIIERAAKVLTDAEAEEGQDTKGALAHRLAEARAEIERWKGIAEGATADLRRYARDEMPERRRISAELYEKQIKEALATPAPAESEVDPSIKWETEELARDRLARERENKP